MELEEKNPISAVLGWTSAQESVVRSADNVFPVRDDPVPSATVRESPRPNRRGSLVNERPQRPISRWSRPVLATVSSLVMPTVIALAAVPLTADARGAQVGQASWYGPGFHGKKTASGERFNQQALTAAHRNLPLGTHARVTNLNNGKTVLVTINDRGALRGRVIDLSRAAARQLAMNGTARVRIETMTP